MRKRTIVLSVAVALSLGLAPSASALALADDDETGTPITAPNEDGTGGANDIPEEIPAPDTIVSDDDTQSWETPGEAPPPPEGCAPMTSAARASTAGEAGIQCVELACDPNSVWYKVASSTKSGKLTRWDTHYKNDSTQETFEWTASSSATVKATVATSGTISGEVALRKIAKVTLGGGVDYGLEGELASTRGYKRTVTFNKPGKWVIYRGVYSGKGSVNRYLCAGNGRSYTRTGYASPSTFNSASETGLINCGESVSGYIPRAAKSKCG